MEYDNGRTTGKRMGVWERLGVAARAAVKAWRSADDVACSRDTSPWPHPIPQHAPPPPSQRRNPLGGLGRDALVEALASGLDGCYTAVTSPGMESGYIELADTTIPEELADALIALAEGGAQ